MKFHSNMEPRMRYTTPPPDKDVWCRMVAPGLTYRQLCLALNRLQRRGWLGTFQANKYKHWYREWSRGKEG